MAAVSAAVLLLIGAVAYFATTRGGDDGPQTAPTPGPAHTSSAAPTSTIGPTHRASPNAGSHASPSAGAGAAGGPAAPGTRTPSRSAGAGRADTVPSSPHTGTSSAATTARTGAGLIPSGAPHTGGGGGPGVRSPLIMALGVLMLLGAAALVLLRTRPTDLRR